jgi:hypothetical protein
MNKVLQFVSFFASLQKSVQWAAVACTGSASPVSEPEAVATGQRGNCRRERIKHYINLLNFEVNMWPVATARGSDTAPPIVYLLFVQSPRRSKI